MNGRKPKGFTLIELLVVISILALLIAILLPALNRAREHGKMAYCMANLRAIYQGIRMYTDKYDGKTHDSPNGGLWYIKGTDRPIPADTISGFSLPEQSYWGVAYHEIIQNREVFICPSAKYVDDFRNFDEKHYYQQATYALNSKLEDTKLDAIAHPSEVVFVQDHMEHRLDNNGDMLHILPGWPKNLNQWRPEFGDIGRYYPNPIGEIYRHLESSNVLWLDGHVAPIEESFGHDVFEYWYLPRRR